MTFTVNPRPTELVIVPADDEDAVPVGAHHLAHNVHPGLYVPLARAGVDAAVGRHHRPAIGLEPDGAADPSPR